MSRSTINVGIVGCGVISANYIEGMRTFAILNIVACTDLDGERAKAKAAHYHIPKACSVEELLADPDIDIVLNLTTPQAHASIALAAIKAGKSVYNEKPLAVTREDAQTILTKAHERGVLVGCAPDIFLGAPLQTCRKLLDDGAIGQPLAANAFLLNHGPESWHPNPAFYYQLGGGPMFDMGPYYLTALILLLGPVSRVSAITRQPFIERSASSHGMKIPVTTPTHIAGLLDFAQGAVATLVTSFDVWATELPAIEIYGTEGTLSIANPSFFRGPVRLRRAGEREWNTIPLKYGYMNGGRGIGVADLAYALRSGREHRANGTLGYHVLDIMHAFHESASTGQHMSLTSTCSRPVPLPLDLFTGTLDE